MSGICEGLNSLVRPKFPFTFLALFHSNWPTLQRVFVTLYAKRFIGESTVTLRVRKSGQELQVAVFCRLPDPNSLQPNLIFCNISWRIVWLCVKITVLMKLCEIQQPNILCIHCTSLLKNLFLEKLAAFLRHFREYALMRGYRGTPPCMGWYQGWSPATEHY